MQSEGAVRPVLHVHPGAVPGNQSADFFSFQHQAHAHVLHANTQQMCEAQTRECCHISTTLQVTDMRTQKEMGTYRGHNRDVTCASWHPLHEELFASGGYDGSLLYWLVSSPTPQASSLLCALPCWCTRLVTDCLACAG